MRRRRRNAGFSAAELSLCFLTIAALSTLVWACGESCRQRARTVSCASNLRQLSLAMRMYMADSGGRGPRGDVPAALIRYIKNEQIFTCPSDEARAVARTSTPSKGPERAGLSSGFRSSYGLATTVWDDGPPHLPIVQDGVPDTHLHDTFQFARLDCAIRRVPASRWYPLQ